jgi:demethylmenaquinone methyltransferase/2-methoxy-6-polyprenyl-1,4-benzoquinol methylase/phosphoethanolamine N-methyltransferase
MADPNTVRSQGPERAPETSGQTIRWARFYDAVSWLVSFGQGPGIRKTTVALADVAAGEKVLDVGCGTGSLAIAVKAKAGAGTDVHGIDAAPEMIDVARRKAARKGADVNFRVGLIEDLPFPDDHFDLALSSFVLHHLPDDLKRTGFAEIRRALKPGGRFLAVDLASTGDGLLGHLFSLAGHRVAQGYADDLMAMMRDTGFTDVEALETRHSQLAFIRARAP